jgi:hypothetical protein
MYVVVCVAIVNCKFGLMVKYQDEDVVTSFICLFVANFFPANLRLKEIPHNIVAEGEGHNQH